MTTLVKNRLHDFIFFALLAAIYLAAIHVQLQILLNHDVSWLVEAARRLIHGGSYTHDFFENNPPMVLYFYIPPVLLSQLFPISIILSVRVYAFLLATLSLAICYDLMQRIFLPRQQVLSRVLLVILAVLYLVLPAYEFAQRDPMALVLTMPYFLLAGFQLEGHKAKSSYTLVIGLLAGVGFTIKPYFIIPLILVELYYAYVQGSALACLRRVDAKAILLVMVTYLLAVFAFNPDYIFTILPFAWPWCRLSARLPWSLILSINPIYFSLMAIVFYLLQKETSYKKLATVLTLALVGFVSCFITQKANYYYHVLPALGMATFLVALLYGLQVQNGLTKKSNYLILGLFIVCLATIACQTSLFMTMVTSHTVLFLLFISFVFALCLYLMPGKTAINSLFASISAAMIISLCAYIFLRLMRGSDLMEYSFFLTLLFLVATLGVAGGRLAKPVGQTMLMGLLGITLFIIPFCYTYFMNEIAGKYFFVADVHNFLQKHAANKPVYFISTRNEAYPYVYNYPNIHSSSRFSGLWMLGSLVKEAHYIKNSDPVRRLAAKNFLADMIAEDLNSQKPAFVFVDNEPIKLNLFYYDEISFKHYKATNIDFNYITYFSSNQNFFQAWQSYRYVATLFKDNAPYVAVYERKA